MNSIPGIPSPSEFQNKPSLLNVRSPCCVFCKETKYSLLMLFLIPRFILENSFILNSAPRDIFNEPTFKYLPKIRVDILPSNLISSRGLSLASRVIRDRKGFTFLISWLFSTLNKISKGVVEIFVPNKNELV